MGSFSVRNTKEILRDPINLAFGLGFPIALLLLLTAIQANVPVELFPVERLTPGIAMFGLSFVSLFSATLIAKDRSTAFLTRLLSSPLTARDFILGYTLPLLPMCLVQSVVCYLTGFCLGLRPGWTVLAALAALIPSNIFFISLGLLCGSLFNDKQVGGICGALLTNMAALLSGTWFDLEMVGGPFLRVAELLPFVHAVDAGRAALSADWFNMVFHLLWTTGWALAALTASIAVFRGKMHR